LRQSTLLPVHAITKIALRIALPFLFIAVVFAATSADAPPETLRIGDTAFKVEIAGFPDSYAGMTYFDKKIIQIDPSSTSTLRRKVYLHELLHVAWHEGRGPFDRYRTYSEDEAIESLVPGLLQILEQNPDAVEYLQRSRFSPTRKVAKK
jgi:hypothetical protein